MTERQIEFKSQHKRITKSFAQHLTSLSGLHLLILTLTMHMCEKFQAETHILSTFARAGAVSLSTICPFVSRSIVTFKRARACVSACVRACVRASRAGLPYMSAYPACVSASQTSIWLGSVAKVKKRSAAHS